MNLTPWDVQSKHIYTIDGVAPPLYSGECRYGGGEAYVLATVSNDEEDTDSVRGPGGAQIHWNYEEITPTLRAQDHGHPPVVVLEDEEADNTDGETIL